MMAKSTEETHQTEVTLVPTDSIRVLNPRVRNPRTFADMVENMAKIGLKRPITVTRRTDTDPQEYDLVCGQGRLEAFIQLKQKAIPAIVIDADESRRELCASPASPNRPDARDRHASRARLQRPADWQQDRRLTGLCRNDCWPLGARRRATGHGRRNRPAPPESRLDISKTDAEGAQRALMDAYTQKKLRGKKLAAARRLIEQREARGKKIHPKQYGRDSRNRRPLTSEALVRAYQKEADRQKLLIKKAELTQGRLLFICQAFRTLLEDDHFVTLLRAEGLETMPGYLQDAINEGATP